MARARAKKNGFFTAILKIFAAYARRRPSFGDIRGPQLEPHCAGQRKYPTGYNRHSRGSLHCDSSLGAGSSTAAEITNESCACGASSPGVARASASRRHQRSSSSSAGPTTASCGTSYPSGRQRTKKHKQISTPCAPTASCAPRTGRCPRSPRPGPAQSSGE